MNLLTRYESASAARADFKGLLDAAESGRVVTVLRSDHQSAVVDAERLRDYFCRTVSPNAEIFAEDGGWVILMPGRPFAAEASGYDAVVSEMIAVLREYAEDWQDHLVTVPNHSQNWGLVQLIELSTDDQLKAWLLGGSE
ncbi:prevent-host-death protein [Subtercola boreus]|uniref:Prevent-host-death protein n=1 Tax=Subtercola boreus TaxID=120213 RepID=A0A3E0VAY3_9MICO|nr:prevent-host-death protein [Subtercola boreus]RFA06974.1 prevent-host-death protein [Subtercola boreus]